MIVVELNINYLRITLTPYSLVFVDNVLHVVYQRKMRVTEHCLVAILIHGTV